MIGKQRSFKVNYIFNTIYQLINVVAPLLTAPYISRVFTATEIGKYSFINSIATYFVLFGGLGTITYGQLEIARVKGKSDQISKIFWSVLFTRLIAILLSAGLYVILSLNMDNEYHNLLYVHLIYIIAQIFDISWLLQGLEDFSTIAIRNIVVRILTVILVFCLVRTAKDIVTYAILMVGGVLVGNIALLRYPRSIIHVYKPKFVDISNVIKQSLPYFVPTIATSVYTVLDKTMLGFLSESISQNGFYDQAHKIEQILVLVVTSLSTVLIPKMAFLFSEKRISEINGILAKSLKYTIMISFPLTIGLFFLSSSFIPLFYGDGYEPCTNLLRIFCILIIIVGLDNVIGKQLLMPSGRQKQFNKGVIIGAFVNAVLNIALIPRFNAYGAAIASVLAEITILLSFIIFTKRDFNYIVLAKESKNYLISSFVLILCLVLCSRIQLEGVLKIIITTISGISVYSITLILLNDELFKKIMSSIIDKVIGR